MMKIITFALAAAIGFGLTAQAAPAEAGYYGGSWAVYTYERNPVCKPDGDTVYRIRLVNRAPSRKAFHAITEGARLAPVAVGVVVPRRDAATFRFRVEEGETFRFAVRHRDEVLEYGTRKGICS